MNKDIIYQKNTYILSLLILFYNKSIIWKRIDVHKKPLSYLDFVNYVFKNKIAIVKRN